MGLRADTAPGGYMRHPAEVTSDRLGDHYERWFSRLTGEEKDAISRVRNALERIAEEDRRWA